MLNVVFAADNNYSPLVSICLLSLLESNKDEFDLINVFVLDDEINEENKTKITNIAKNYPCNVSFIKTKKLDSLDIAILGIEKKLTGISLTNYARLFVGSLLPQDIDKVLYLDCDGLVVDSLKTLWQTDLTRYYCAGVVSTLNETLLDYFGYTLEDNYINSGVLLIDLKKWREENVEKRFIEYFADNQDKFYYHDQGAINEVFRNQIKILEPKYNLQFYFQFYDYDLAKKFEGMWNHDYYTREIVEKSVENPVFLHFCGTEYDRPWTNKTHIHAELFLKYAKMADCEEIINYIDAPNLRVKLFYDGQNNKFIKFLLDMIPGKLIAKIINENLIALYESERQKAIQQMKD